MNVGAGQHKDKRTPRRNSSDNVNGVLELTPDKPKGRNLQVTKTTDTTPTVTTRLNEFEVVK